jgi:hypothetical protein
VEWFIWIVVKYRLCLFSGHWPTFKSCDSLLDFTPLIELDVMVSRIQLSDKVSCLRPRDVAVTQPKLD